MKFKFILLAILSSFLAGIIYSSNAFALTDFEKNLNFTDEYIVKSSKDSPMDISNSFRTIIRSACNSEDDFYLYLNDHATCEDALKVLDNTFSKQGDYVMSLYYHNLSSGNVVSTTSLTPRLFVSESGMLYNHTSGKYNYLRSDSIIYTFTFSYSSKAPHTGYDVSIYKDRVFNTGYSVSTRVYSSTLAYDEENKIYSAKMSNIPEYSSDYTGKKIQDSTIDFTPKTGYQEFTSSIFEEFKQCQAFDLGCLVENFLIFIRNVFAFIFNLPKIITEIFNQFFNDNKDLFSNAFTELNDSMRKKLGFLTFPFDFLGKLYNSISYSSDNMNEGHCFWGRKGAYSDPTNWSGVPTCPEICADKILGDASICVNFGELERRMPEVWAVGINILRFGVLISLIEILRRKYLSVVRG